MTKSQKGLFGLLLASSIAFVVYAVHSLIYQILQLVIGGNYYDHLALESVFGTVVKANHYIYALLLFVAIILFFVHSGKKPLAIVGGILLMLENIFGVTWFTLHPILNRMGQWQFTNTYGPWIELLLAVLYGTAVILIAVHYHRPGMLAMGICISVIEIVCYPALIYCVCHWLITNQVYQILNLVFTIPLVIFVMVYMFKWVKTVKRL